MLLETGKMEVNLQNKDGWMPLLGAAFNEHDAVVKMLLETGKMDVHLQRPKYGS